MRHDILDCWEVGEDVICRGEVTYWLPTGREFLFPFVDIFRMAGGRIARYLVYVDQGSMLEHLVIVDRDSA